MSLINLVPFFSQRYYLGRLGILHAAAKLYGYHIVHACKLVHFFPGTPGAVSYPGVKAQTGTKGLEIRVCNRAWLPLPIWWRPLKNLGRYIDYVEKQLRRYIVVCGKTSTRISMYTKLKIRKFYYR